MFAMIIGLRANATAMPVPSSSRSVCSAPSSTGKNGSWRSPPRTRRRTRRPRAPWPCARRPPSRLSSPPSTFMAVTLPGRSSRAGRPGRHSPLRPRELHALVTRACRPAVGVRGPGGTMPPFLYIAHVHHQVLPAHQSAKGRQPSATGQPRVGLRGGSVSVLLIPVWLVVLGLLTIVFAHVAAYDRDHSSSSRTRTRCGSSCPRIRSRSPRCASARGRSRSPPGVIVIAHLVWVVPPTLRTVPVTRGRRHAPHVRIASANVRYDNLDHAPLLAELARTHADVIVMEEVTPAWWKAIEVSGLLHSHPVIVKAVRPDPGGMVVLSRRPLRHVVIRHAGGWPIITATVVLGGSGRPSRGHASRRAPRDLRAQPAGATRRSPRSPAISPGPGFSSATSTPVPTTAGSTSCSTSACATRTSRWADRSRRRGRTAGTSSRRCCSTTCSPTTLVPLPSARAGGSGRTTGRSSWTWPSSR